MSDTARPYGSTAFKYKLAGWLGVLPVGNRPRQKEPVPAGFTGWKHTDKWPTDDELAEWVNKRGTCNVALRLPRNVIGLDVDAYKEGRRETMLAIVDRHGPLPPTWTSTSRTDSSGIRFYRLPFEAERGDLDERIKHPDDGPEAGEVIQHGHRYALVWPSIHPDTGNAYQWTHKATGETGRIPQPSELAELPQEWVDHLRGDCSCFEFDWRKIQVGPSKDPVADTFDKWHRALTDRTGSRHDAARNGCLALTAFKYRGWPGAAEYLDRLKRDFLTAVTADNSRTESQARAEWQRMIDGAHDLAPSSTIPQWEPPNRQKPKGPRIEPEGGTLADLMSRELEPIRFVIDGLIPEGLTILAGKPKLGKSWLALDMALAVCAGRDVLGHATNPAEVLYIALEDGERRLQDRVRILDGHKIGKALSRFHYRTTWPAFTGDGIATLEQWMADHPDTRLIVVDTFGKARGPLAGKDKYQEEYDLAGRLQTFAVAHRVAVIIVHHIRKQGADDWLESISGSQAITGAADAILGLFRERGQMDATLRLVSRDLDEKDVALRFDSGRWESMGDAALYRQSVERTAILEALEALGEGSASDLAPLVDKSPANVSKMLVGLFEAGLVKRVRRGVYSLKTPVDSVDSVDTDSLESTQSTQSTDPLESTQSTQSTHLVDQSGDLEDSLTRRDTCDQPGDLTTPPGDTPEGAGTPLCSVCDRPGDLEEIRGELMHRRCRPAGWLAPEEIAP